MKQKLLNSIRLRVCAFVAFMCAVFTGQVWATDVTYDFTSTSNFYTTSDGNTHPSTGSSNVLSSFYGSDRAAFTATGDVYFNSGYLMAKKSCTITLPTFSGKKITSIAITNSSGCSTSTSVAIKSGSSTASAAQTWKTQSKTYTYSIDESYQSSALKISVSSANAQITQIKITTEAISHTLTYSAASGTIAGVDAGSNAVANGASVAENATVTLTATPSSGYEFDSWEVSGTGSSLSSDTTNPTTFTMGTANATVTAIFVVADTREEADLSYTNASESAVIAAGTSHKQTLNNPNSLDGITYSSSDETVATVASDGTVTLKKAGEVTITATFAGNASYKPGNASYTLTITNKYLANLVFDENEVEKLTTDDAFTNDIVTDPDLIDVVYSSSDTDVATIDTDGEVTIVGAGTTTITATIDDDDYEATEFTYTLTVSKADAPISFSSASAEVALDETESFEDPMFSNAQGLEIAWTSSDETVATVNSSTGAITSFLKAGETTITATSTATPVYKSGSVSYTLTVTKAAESLPFAAAFSSSLGDFTVTPDATNTGVTWAINSSSAKASGYYSSSNHTGTAWLVSPYINISSDYATLSFQHAGNYFEADANMEDEATLWIREKGGDWEELTIDTYPTDVNTSTKSKFVSTSNSLSSYSGKKVQIGFKYLGNSTSSGSWWVKNFRVADDREEAPISFEDATVYELLKNKDTYTGQALTNDEDLTVSYTSSNTDVATVNSSTGVVTIKAVGETNITATYAETASYKANTATYKLVVTSKGAAGIEYAEDAVSKKITLGTYTHELTNPNELTVAYTSSDEKVATVNASTGEVTMLKVGETTITATFTENEDYEGAAVSYTLTVIKDDAVLSFAISSVNAGLAEGTYTQAVTTTPADLSVTYSSSDETVGTVADDGTVTLLKKGSTTITANFAGNASYNSANASYTLNVVVDYTTLPFSYTSGKSGIGETLTTGTTGLMQSGLGSDYKSSPYLKFDNTGDYIILKTDAAPGELKFDIQGNSYSAESTSTFTVQYSANGSSYTDLESYTELSSTTTKTFTNIPSTTRYIKWIYTQKGANSGGNVGLGNINLKGCESVSIGSAGYTTYVTDGKVTMPSGVEAYIATAVNPSTIHLEPVTNVPADEPIVLKADAGTYYLPIITTATDDVSANLLLASTGITSTGTQWALAKLDGVVGFYKVKSGVEIPEGKAYLNIDGGGSVKEFLTFDFDTDAISDVRSKMDDVRGDIFNLAGQKMNRLQKGINIINGKKIYVK